MIQMHAVKGKKKEQNVWGDDFVIEVEARVDNAVYNLYRNGSYAQNVFDIDVIDKTTNIVISTQSSTSSASNNITLPTAGNYYIRCRGYYAGFRLNYDSNYMLVDVINVGTNEWLNVQEMFKNCSKLTSLDLSNFDTSKVTNMSMMFQSCRLTSLDLSNFDTSNVSNMNSMFTDCSNLTELDLTNFNTSKVTSMANMFMRCNNLTSIYLSNFDTSNVSNMVGMFYDCSVLDVDLSGWCVPLITSLPSYFVTYAPLMTAEKLPVWGTCPNGGNL